jgi:hypothetical protein
MRIMKRAIGGSQQSLAGGRRTSRGRRGRLPGIVIAAAALTGLAMAPAASAATTSAAAARPAKTATAKPPATARPPAKAQRVKEHPVKEEPAAPSRSEQRRLAAAAVRHVLAHSAVPDTCSGPISPDTIYPCSTPSSSGTDTFTITLADTADVVYVLPLSVSGNELGFTLTAPDASTVSCQQSDSGQYICPTSQAGTYTLAVSNGGSSYTLDYTALLSDTGCTAINPSFAAPAIAGSLAAGQTGSCYTLDVPSGSELYLMGLSPSAYPTEIDVYDSTGANQNCNLIGANTCTVGGTGPYRVFVYSNGTPDTYQLQLYNLTNPQGCAATPQLAYGQVPNTSSTDPCRKLTVTTAGSYQVVPVPAPNDAQVAGTVYAANGSVACQYYQYPFCPLAVGSYDFVVDPGQPASPFGFDFIAGDQSKGCTATADTGFQNGPATGKFAGIGEEICLTLPTPDGKADYFFEQQNADGTPEPNVEVIDATGAVQCGSNADFSYDSCTLSGTAPFRVLLSAESTPDSYRLLINRTDSTAGCATWPQSGFGGSWGATVTITQPANVKCLVIPAGQHSTGEMIDYSNAANVVDGEIDVRDPAGNDICTGTSTAICSYQPGVTYTALVSSTNPDGDTYHLVRRDVSQTAKCAAPASTAIGGPSTTFTLTSDLDTVCYRVTAATADKLWFDARTTGNTPASPPGSGPASAVLQVTNASGAIVCRQFGITGCRVTGSADYQLIVTAEGYAGIAITTHVDAWRVATASGWAAQCTSHSVDAADNWGPLSLTLTEQATGLCELVNGLETDQSFGIFGTDTAPGQEIPFINIYTNWDWTQSFINGMCGQGNVGQFGFSCSTNEEQNPSQGILLVAPGSAQSPTTVTMWGVCTIQCSAPTKTSTLTSVSPASQPAGSNTIVITGTNLTMATQFQLLGNSGPSVTGTTVSVNAAGTQLTLLLNTTGIPTGTYNAWLSQVSCSPPVPCPGYLPNAYTVTAAPAPPSPELYTALNPARILDTQTGLGAPKAKVGAYGTVTLTVAGQGGVPAKNATAVALDVTAISPSAAGHLIAYPAGTTRPGVTDLSFGAGQTVTNLVVVKLNGGKISLYNADGGALDLAADVVGYYTTSTGATFTATSPSRILDTQSGLGAPKAKVGAHGMVTLTVAGHGGVPTQGATAVAVNVQALSPTATGSLTIYPNGTSQPGTAALSFSSGQNTAALAVVRLVNGKVSIYNSSSGQLDLTADVVGYYGSGGATFLPVGPTRVLDTQSGLGGSGQKVLPHAAAVTGVVNVPALANANVTAVVLQVTVLNAQRAGTLTAFPDQASVPVSTFPFAAGQAVTSLVVVPVVNGSVDFYNGSSGTIQVLADLLGFYSD